MTNSDTTFGTHNKKTVILSQIDDGSTALITFANANDAVAFHLTSEAQAVFNECGTELQWALVADGNGDNTKLKYTIAFGSKGAGTAEADDWAGQFNSRKQALIDSNGWVRIPTGDKADPTTWPTDDSEAGDGGATTTPALSQYLIWARTGYTVEESTDHLF